MTRAILLTLLALGACQTDTERQMAQLQTFGEGLAATVQGEGTFAYQVIYGSEDGKLRTMLHDPACLEETEKIADLDGARKRMPMEALVMRFTAEGQRYVVGGDDKGVCVALGRDLRAHMVDVWLSSPSADPRLRLSFTGTDTTPWWDCLYVGAHTNRSFDVGDPWNPKVEAPLDIHAYTCTGPLPEPILERVGKEPPSAPPPAPPQPADVVKLIQAFEAALAGRDWSGALGLLACYDHRNPVPYGTCAISEVVGLRAANKPDARGVDWTGGALDPSKVEVEVAPVEGDPTRFHGLLPAGEDGGRAAVTVQWVEGAWKLVGDVREDPEAIMATPAVVTAL